MSGISTFSSNLPQPFVQPMGRTAASAGKEIAVGLVKTVFHIALFICTIGYGFGYFIPTAVALFRGHHNKGAIIVLNLFLGWTLIGWVVALVWACTQVRK
jgi:hypothetical protein